MDKIAIQVHEAYKVFHKQRRWLPRLRKRNGDERKPVVAVDRISFDVQRKEIFGVLGPNGSGKSTLVRLIATLLLPDGGSVTLFGHDVEREPMAVLRRHA